jgi:hypothetical protein
MRVRVSVPVWEALGFAAGVVVYIWLQPLAPYGIGILVAAMLVSFWKHAETVESLGLGWKATVTTLGSWWPALLVLAAGAVLLGRQRLTELAVRALLYLLWCTVQQLAYQKMISDRLRAGMGSSWKAHTASGILFATVHLPNPVLVPATLVWGTVSSYLFERFPSVVALGTAQFLLSTILFLLTPIAWNHGMRVGPGYWAVSSMVR